MFKPHPTVLFYDALATSSETRGEAYDVEWTQRIPGHGVLLPLIPQILAALEHSVHRVLDVGCGTGLAAQAALPNCAPDAHVTLVDASPSMLLAARERLGKRVDSVHAYDFVSGDDLEEVLPARAFDLILCSYALTHLDDQHKRITLERLANSVTVNGLLIVINEVAADRPGGWPVVDRINARALTARLEAGKLPRLGKMAPPPQHLSRVDDLTSWMARGGLAVSCPALWLGSALLLGLRAPVNP